MSSLMYDIENDYKYQRENFYNLIERGQDAIDGILEIFKQLIKYDTPTICNALELLDPKCRNQGYTKKEFFCLNKNLPPIIGFVRTAKIFSNDKNKQMTLKQKKRYYQYMGNEKVPKICIVEDSNINPVGCFWGEVQ